MAVLVLGLAFGAVLRTSVNHDLQFPVAPCIMMHRFIDNYSNYEAVQRFSNFMQY